MSTDRERGQKPVIVGGIRRFRVVLDDEGTADKGGDASCAPGPTEMMTNTSTAQHVSEPIVQATPPPPRHINPFDPLGWFHNHEATVHAPIPASLDDVLAHSYHKLLDTSTQKIDARFLPDPDEGDNGLVTEKVLRHNLQSWYADMAKLVQQQNRVIIDLTQRVALLEARS